MPASASTKRARVRPAVPAQRARLRVSLFIALAALLVLPFLALRRAALPLNPQWIGGWALAASLFTFLAYRSDKRRAESGEWRTPESTLQLMAFVGGWPGAFLAQRVFRHETAKLSFQSVFWLIVCSQQLVALDSLLSWRISKVVTSFVAAHTHIRE